MPDGDYLVWRVGAKWRKLYNLLKSGAPAVQAEDAFVSALADTVRVLGGVPNLHAVAAQLCARSGSGAESRRVVAVSRTAEGAVLRRLLDEVAQPLAARMQLETNLTSPRAAADLLAARFLRRVAKACLDQLVPGLVTAGRSMADLRVEFKSLYETPLMDDLSDRLVRRPTGEGLRAPDRRTSVKPLRELLDTGLDDL
ncbi:MULTISPECIES: hypothetical protein [Saccharothrix]|uniref:hypothetical protein n=1 Tax=Saccharothrix TaxID=2071 RepID=UPI000939E6A8|nr:hypothetical protein [Saccharothrix sp. CB00851]OKI17388.1 hypothetical protein A6A25_41000 [Saccharothrix sp. CB00851]